MVTCRQIAEMVGVSRQAAASVLNDAPVCLVSPEKKKKILQLARELHYVRSNAARTLARGKSGIIGILTGGLHIRKNQLNLILLDHELRKAGYLPCIVYTRSEEQHLVNGIH
ncbi:MAG: LacI family DNA-binding transcriptional regulator, partial [Lentisphaeria bacterium]|nr:LacI family DNA-binding transcriptional regulator [Lentisphaeria bacterium]